jgi:hypothetical protein
VAYDAVTQATASDTELVAFRDDMSRRAIGPSSLGPRRGPSNFALQAFGRPERLTNCDCERTSEPSLLQSLFLRNDQDVLRMIDRPEGWIKQVSAELGLEDRTRDRREVADSKPDGDRKERAAKGREVDLREVRRQIAMLEVRAARLAKNGEAEQAERVRQRAARLKREARAALDEARMKPAAADKADRKDRPEKSANKANDEKQTKRETDADAKPSSGEADVGAIIRSAYLRTLSRPPTADEEKRIRQHLGTTGKAPGLRDVIWALVNSKEFIINH